MNTVDPSAVILLPEVQRLIRTKARCLVGKAGFRVSDREDLEQDLTLDLLRRLPEYKPDRGSLDLFVRILLERAASRMMRDRHAACRDYRRLRMLPVDDERSASERELERDLEEVRTIDLRQDVGEALQHLEPRYRLLAELLTRENLTRAAQLLHQPRSTTHGHAARIASDLRKMGFDDY